MPGLVGLITNMPRHDAQARLQRMVAALRHETSYATGTWCDESLGLYVGWAEREHDVKCLPILSANGDLALHISGETFAEAGEPSDNRAYLLQHAKEDACFPKRLNGLFHGVLADKRNRRAILFNDRYGMHRLYYRDTEDTFYFAAEAKAILEVCPETRCIDPDGVAEFISCGCTLENRTIFKQISILSAGSAWVFQARKLHLKGSYFSPKEWEDQAPLDCESYYRELKDAFSARIPHYFKGANPVGVSLTGGLDSRILMAWSGAPPSSVRCFSFGSSMRDSQDVKIARRVAQTCQQPHETIEVGDECLLDFPRLAERTVFLSDGCVEVKHAPDLYASERAAQLAPTRVTGNYGGEVLRRVRAFKPVDPPRGLFAAELDSQVARARETFSKVIACHPLSFAVFRQAPWRQYGLLALENTQQMIRSPFLDNEIVRIVFRAPPALRDSNDLSLRLIAEGNAELEAIRTDRGLGGRLPRFLSALQQVYLDLTFKAEYAYDYGMPDSLVRMDRTLKSFHLERAFLGRHKFTHFRVWYRDSLSDYVRQMLLDPKTLARPYLERFAVERMVREHSAGERNHTTAIHKVLTLELIHRLFID